jgi:FkbH-like protein
MTDESETLDRVRELFARTTQFNATGETFTQEALRRLTVFVLRMRDRLADHGLVGAAVVDGKHIRNVVISCRVIGLGGERALLSAMIDAARGRQQTLFGRIVATDRNSPVRNLFADHGFTPQPDGVWALPLGAPDMSASVETIFRIAGGLVPDDADTVA